jgi:hypothetical protein
MGDLLEQRLFRASEARERRAVDIEHADEFVAGEGGTTISAREAGSQAMWPGKACTSATTIVRRSTAAAPHTPPPSGMRTHAGLP